MPDVDDPVVEPWMSNSRSTSPTTDQLNAAITQLTFNALNNGPIQQIMINQLQAVAAQLTPGPPLSQLQDGTAQLQWCSRNNAPVPVALLGQLGNVWSQLINGPTTTNPADLQAITLIEQQILLQEPDWAGLLWMNWSAAPPRWSCRCAISIR